MDRRFCAVRMTLLSGGFTYFAAHKVGRGVEVGDFATREEAAAEAARLNDLPGHRTLPASTAGRCALCGGPTPCLRQD